MIKDSNLGDMTTLSSVTNTAIKRGYTENFQLKHGELFAPSTNISYLPNEVKIDNFYRFEGASDPMDNAILYLLETHDGLKGIVIDSYGTTADDGITDFVKQIPQVPKVRDSETQDVKDWQ